MTTTPSWLHELIHKSLEKSVWGALNPASIERVRKKNENKTHFIPVGIRVFSGVVQSMNIRYGNFIQVLLNELVAREQKLTINEISGTRYAFETSPSIDTLVDQFISDRKRSSSSDPDAEYQLLRSAWSSKVNEKTLISPNDVDLLFRAQDGITYYVELKFNDDHDTGKHPDIFRKVLKTGMALEQHLNEEVVPCVYYFNQGERNLVKFLPDNQRFSGDVFFSKFLSVDYGLVAEALRQVSEDPAVKKKFSELFNDVQ
jgi:hypothetical protein